VRTSTRIRLTRRDAAHVETGVWVTVGIGVPDVDVCFDVSKAGPHEALIVYGFRGTRMT
jgi:hypothetical protein